MKNTKTGMNISDCFKIEMGVLNISPADIMHFSVRQKDSFRVLIISEKLIAASVINEMKHTIMIVKRALEKQFASVGLFFIFSRAYQF